METIQVVLDTALLRATDGAARRARANRSALIRKALREYLKRQHEQGLEARDRQGYERQPQDAAELEGWERVASCPEP